MRRLALGLGSLVVATFAAAATPATVTITGNKRTRAVYIERMVNECLLHQEGDHPGEPWSGPELEQCIINSKLFSEVKVELDDQDIKLDVKEKWTLIPIPMVSAGSGKSRRAGAFLLESNFLGLGMNLAMGGTVSNTGSSYFGFLADPSLFFSNWNYSLSVGRQSEEFTLSEGEDEERDAFREEALTSTGSFGYKAGRWLGTASLARALRNYSTVEGFAAPSDNASTRLGMTLGFDARNYKLYFSEGLALRVTGWREVLRTDDERHVRQYDAQLSWQVAALSDQALQLQLAGGMVEGGAKGDALRLGGGRGLRGIEPRTAWAGRYAAASADYQIPVHYVEAGTFTVAPFADAGRIADRGGESEVIDYWTVGGGAYFFVRSIALPGLGFEVGFNNRYMRDFFVFSAGLSL